MHANVHDHPPAAPLQVEIAPALLEAAVELRHALHAEPELSHAEHRTAARVRAMLERHGVRAIRPLGATAGLVVDVEGARPGPLVVLKADLDALPMQERCALPFRSRVDGVMHACGHDVHTAALCAAAIALAARAERLAGRVRCVFQPAEEAEPLGARVVVRERILDGASAVFACHVDPELPLGTIGGLSAGPRTASADEITIDVHGQAAHGARPHQGIDAIAIAATLVQELQKLVSRSNDPRRPMVLTVGRLAGGASRNTIPEHARLECILRTTHEDQRQLAWTRIRSMAALLAEAHGGRASVEITAGEPVITNDARLVELAKPVAAAIVGESCVTDRPPPSMGADDFGFYVRDVPGVMLRLGVRDESRGMQFPLHHPEFVADDAVVGIGARLLANLSVAALGTR